MIDKHESVTVRYIEELISKNMGYFVSEIQDLLLNLPEDDARRNALWFSLLTSDHSEWKQSDLDSVYLYIITEHWKYRNIKPPAEIAYFYYYGPLPDEYDGENKLKKWCDSDDRHLSFNDAVAWIEGDECSVLIGEYEETGREREGQAWKDVSDEINGKYYANTNWSDNNEASQGDFETSFLRYMELGSLKNKWHFIASKVKYIETITPEAINDLKLYLLRIALVSQPISFVFGKQKEYERAVLREKELLFKVK